MDDDLGVPPFQEGHSPRISGAQVLGSGTLGQRQGGAQLRHPLTVERWLENKPREKRQETGQSKCMDNCG